MLAPSASDPFSLCGVAIPLVVLIVNAAIAISSQADVVPNPLFTAGAVLQRDIKLPVWGTAAEGEKVTIEFAGQRVTTRASQGKWLVHLQPLKASASPQTLSISGNNSLEIEDLLVGDVWLCSGQSNMEWPLAKSANGRAVAAKADEPKIRLFEVATTQSLLPLDQAKGRWTPCKGKHAASFSAVAYYFGKELQAHLKIPIGLIGSYVGGSAADRWMSARALRALHIQPKERGPSSLYNGMIHPLQPYPIRGVIWYQGEANRGRPSQYQKLFPALIADWREAWKQGPFPFLFVQLPPFNAIPPELREIQAGVWKNTARTGMVVITDHGSPTNIHPPVKEPVGKRLALAARAISYGEQLVWSGPIYREMSILGHRAVIHFNSTGSGLTAMPAGDAIKGFTLAGNNGKFLPAEATIRGNQIEVSHPSIPQPVAVRYGWAAAPDLNLFNKEGLPAMPFRTDTPQPKL
jgi:sialate O-acetylesterase